MTASWKQLLFQIPLMLISTRHINTKKVSVTPTPLAPISALQPEMRSAVLKGEGHTETIKLHNPVNLTLECIWPGKLNKVPNITTYWRKDGTEILESYRTASLENEQINLKREFIINNEESLGNYSCVFGSEAEFVFILRVPQIHDVRDKPIVSYVGDAVMLTCKMDKTDPMPTTWNWYKDNGTDKEQIFEVATPERYKITNDKWSTKLQVKNLTAADGGRYYCGAVYAIGLSLSPVDLKVITFMEPLKPFISIVVEVVVLVSVILIYERNRSKKKVAEETGTTSEQNAALPQGEDPEGDESSSMRHRKV
ncbi:embigin [Menidia menidia]